MVPVDQTEQTKRPVQTLILYRISIFLVEQFRYISVHKIFIFLLYNFEWTTNNDY
jgi:hypothetical protein